MLSDKIASLGSVGDTVDAVVLYVREESQTSYMMGPFDVELMTYVFDVMPAMVNNVLSRSVYVVRNMYNNAILFCS